MDTPSQATSLSFAIATQVTRHVVVLIGLLSRSERPSAPKPPPPMTTSPGEHEQSKMGVVGVQLRKMTPTEVAPAIWTFPVTDTLPRTEASPTSDVDPATTSPFPTLRFPPTRALPETLNPASCSVARF
jgi:hypothetical protein